MWFRVLAQAWTGVRGGLWMSQCDQNPKFSGVHSRNTVSLKARQGLFSPCFLVALIYDRRWAQLSTVFWWRWKPLGLRPATPIIRSYPLLPTTRLFFFSFFMVRTFIIFASFTHQKDLSFSPRQSNLMKLKLRVAQVVCFPSLWKQNW